MNITQKAALNRALKVIDDLMNTFEKEERFDEDYESERMINILIDLLDAFIVQIEVRETKNLLKKTIDLLFQIIDAYNTGYSNKKTEIGLKKIKEKAAKLKAQINL